MSDLEVPAEASSAEAVDTEDADHLDDLVPALEAILFAAGDPLSLEDLKMALPSSDRPLAEAALERLEERYRVEQRGLQIRRVAGGLRMTTRPEHDRVLRALYRQRNRHRRATTSSIPNSRKTSSPAFRIPGSAATAGSSASTRVSTATSPSP